mmetsp:Transcript_18614/g.44632  ORF Transcript_18614/g.44632 Transcript_18614/m.44632 type:complete len:347 (+) Transcript_18614:29-1069(+)
MSASCIWARDPTRSCTRRRSAPGRSPPSPWLRNSSPSSPSPHPTSPQSSTLSAAASAWRWTVRPCGRRAPVSSSVAGLHRATPGPSPSNRALSPSAAPCCPPPRRRSSCCPTRRRGPTGHPSTSPSALPQPRSSTSRSPTERSSKHLPPERTVSSPSTPLRPSLASSPAAPSSPARSPSANPTPAPKRGHPSVSSRSSPMRPVARRGRRSVGHVPSPRRARHASSAAPSPPSPRTSCPATRRGPARSPRRVAQRHLRPRTPSSLVSTAQNPLPQRFSSLSSPSRASPWSWSSSLVWCMQTAVAKPAPRWCKDSMSTPRSDTHTPRPRDRQAASRRPSDSSWRSHPL